MLKFDLLEWNEMLKKKKKSITVTKNSFCDLTQSRLKKKMNML